MKFQSDSYVIGDLDQCPIVRAKGAELDSSDDDRRGASNGRQSRGRWVVVQPDKAQNLPTLIRHQMMWNFEIWKPMSALDMCRALDGPSPELNNKSSDAASTSNTLWATTSLTTISWSRW